MRLTGVLLIAISASAFGAMPIFAHYAYLAGVTPLTALFFRFAIAALCLCSYLVLSQSPLPRGKNLRTLVLLGSLGMVLQSLTFFSALTVASPAVVVLLLYLYPSLVVAISIGLLHRPSTPSKLAALAIALAGTAFTIGPLGEAQIVGIILGLISAVIYAIYVLVCEQVIQVEQPITACSIMISSAAVVYGGLYGVIGMRQGLHLPNAISGWWALGALGLVSTVLSTSTLFAGIKRLGAPTASILSTLEPAVTIGLSIVILQQPVTLRQMMGGGLILGAVVILALEKKPPPNNSKSLINDAKPYPPKS